MDYFWAAIKTLGFLASIFLGIIVAFLFAFFGIPFLMEHWEFFICLILSAMFIGIIVSDFIVRLEKERQKRKKNQESA